MDMVAVGTLTKKFGFEPPRVSDVIHALIRHLAIGILINLADIHDRIHNDPICQEAEA